MVLDGDKCVNKSQCGCYEPNTQRYYSVEEIHVQVRALPVVHVVGCFRLVTSS